MTADSAGDLSTAGDPCPSEDELVRMVEGVLDAASIESIEAHIDTCEDCGAVVAGLGAVGTPPKPRQVGRYLLDRRIAAGGMGEVWAAWDPKLRREIAVKLVRPPRKHYHARERERLLREARALAKLTHPNVIAVHDVGEAGGEVFIATELVAGDTLASRGGAGKDWRTIVRLYAQAARGLAAAHAVGLVHRDVKPANLLIGADGRVRVADFGLAIRADTPSPIAPTETPSMAGTSSSVTETGAIAGTPAYMAPEQRFGTAVDAPADQFALCASLGEAVAGRRPPMDLSREKMIAFVEERRTREPALDQLCGVIAQGMALDPGARFSDMTALGDALDAIVAPTDAPSSERTSSERAPADRAPADRAPASETARTARSSTPRRPIALIVIATIVAAAAGATAVWLMQRGHDDPGGAAAKAIDEAGGSSAGSGSAIDDRGSATDVEPDPTPTTTPTTTTQAPGAVPVRKTRPAPVATSTIPPSPTAPSAGPASVGSTPVVPSGGVTIKDVSDAIERRDGKACRAALAALTSPPPTDFRVASLHAVCEMVAGNCAGGIKEQRALNIREGSPPDSAQITADLWCPVGTDLRRLSQQVTMFPRECDRYLAPARAAAKTVSSDDDKRVVGSILSSLATCHSHRGNCDLARKLLAEAQVFIPALALNELNAQCR